MRAAITVRDREFSKHISEETVVDEVLAYRPARCRPGVVRTDKGAARKRVTIYAEQGVHCVSSHPQQNVLSRMANHQPVDVGLQKSL
jgi:hypothetical protein